MSKTALVTGGTKGIGRAVCESLLSDGWIVVATFGSDTQTAAERTETYASEAPGRFFALQADCTDLSRLSDVDTFLDEHRLMLDALVINAGLTDRSDFSSITPESWRRVFTANIDYPVFLIQRLFNRMNEQAAIVFTGSLMGIYPHAMSLSYGVSKAAVHALVKNLVKFMAPKHIRVNAVAPGFVETDWHRNKPVEIRNNITDKLAAGRFCSPEEVAEVYLMLIHNTYMNGEVIVCDGGYATA
ncbi:MAG: SDR family oxidoreductase [Bacteroidales bacterium]|nr:SDR family oxidoreductase [Bacteroidales bacterium]